jgi:diacylglycerol kinase (ATP)
MTDIQRDPQGDAVPNKKKGIARIIAATGYSVAGLRSAFSTEEAFRIEVYVLLVMTPVALYFGQSRLEQVALVGVILLWMIVELLNTAVEAVVDRVSEDFHPLAKTAKDIGSAAVLITMVLVAFVWGMLLL